MTIGFLLLIQISIMSILVIVGYIISLKGLVTFQGSVDMGKIGQYIVLPLIVIRNFMVEKTAETNHLLLESLFFASITMIISMGVARIFFG